MSDVCTRIEENGVVTYYAENAVDVYPDNIICLYFVIKEYVDGTSWPGLPDTRCKTWGITAPFKGKWLTIAPGFETEGVPWGSLGGRALAMIQSGTHPLRIPAEHLEKYPDQPEYKVVPAVVAWLGSLVGLTVVTFNGNHDAAIVVLMVAHVATFALTTSVMRAS